jgi:hypothetical protein
VSNASAEALDQTLFFSPKFINQAQPDLRRNALSLWFNRYPYGRGRFPPRRRQSWVLYQVAFKVDVFGRAFFDGKRFDGKRARPYERIAR